MSETVKKTTKPRAPKPVSETKIDTEALAEIIDVEAPVANLNFEDKTDDVEIKETTLVDVKSNVIGKLGFTGRDGSINWTKCGEIQQVSFRELRDIKSTAPTFYESQWILPLGVSKGSKCDAKPADIYEQLGITKFYRNYIEPSSLEILKWTSEEILAKVPMISVNAKENLIVALRAYVEKRALSDLNLIDAWEKALGCQLSNKG